MLSLVATPIGNLGDITLRAVETLKAADEIWCEDTRHSRVLLDALEIKKPLVSCHEHNEKARAAELMDKLAAGKEIAYISDAGMPGISDPGAVLVAACIEHGMPYTVLPGANAVLTAAVLSGFEPRRFSFFGFLPRDNKERKQFLKELSSLNHLAILYESPHRVGATFRLLYETLGDRPAALCRELTKKFETCDRGTLSELAEKYEAEDPRGECVLLIECAAAEAEASQEDIESFLRGALREGLSVKDAAGAAAERFGVKKREAYNLALSMKED
ncbi:MAG: 16S rRNA (cytidine(1402)-2'-O)-methyltransferase [Clostridia bacterium]|nr:16S rRNA (cytidine(1402)-2'-O)-methyltransferase [Clostridia bacterium]